MPAFLLTLILTLAMLLVIGVHTSTQRVFQVLAAAIVIFVASIILTPTAAGILTPAGPARTSNGYILRDDSGRALYSQEGMRSLQSAEAALGSVTYLCASLACASLLLLLYRFFAVGMDTARRPPIPFEEKRKK